MLIIFDLDDTLIDTVGCSMPVKLKLALDRMVEAGLKVDCKEDCFSLLMEINQSSLNGEEAISRFVKEVNGSPKFLEIGLKSYYEYALLDITVKQLDGAGSLLDILKDTHDLALVTSGNEQEQRNKMVKAGIDSKLFSKIAFVDGYDKEDYYSNFAQQFGYNSQDVLVCGDKYRTDLKPAKKLGMKTVHIKWGRGKIDCPENGEVDFSTQNLHELKKFIKELESKINEQRVDCDKEITH